ncbi:MAG: Fur family transcriptional regulator, stress-responsive regulator [Actinomycetota bacterium]|nr:Fur family transcriptional regulator, stress-responsive regulator [Actinomycetota bacterium]
MKSVEELTALFRSRGLKVTPQRQVIFRVLGSTTRHPTAEAVYAAVRSELPTISLRTVYQSLNDLSAMGELSALDVGTGSTRFDPTLEPHHHLVCEACGTIEDLHHDFPGVVLPAPAAERFEVNATEIVFRGRCSSCAARDDPATIPFPGTPPDER